MIGCYRMVRDAVDDVIVHLCELEAGHRARGSAQFYEVRDARFNAQRRAFGAAGGPYTPELAAMLIYLNRTGYNGLFRVNSHGEFNVPAGRQTSLRICDAENLRCPSRALRRRGVRLQISSFASALTGAGHGDFVYLIRPTHR